MADGCVWAVGPFGGVIEEPLLQQRLRVTGEEEKALQEGFLLSSVRAAQEGARFFPVVRALIAVLGGSTWPD